MSDSINIPLSDPWRQSVTITPEIARKIVDIGFREVSLSKRETTDLGRFPSVIPNQADMVPSAYASAAQSMGAKPVEFDKPAAPTDDEAIVTAMVNAFITGLNASSKTYDGAVKKILEAIRRGEVPGLPSPDEHAALKAEVERLRSELAGAKVTVSVDGAIMKAAQIMEKERDAAIARAEELDRELGAHKASRIAYASEFDGDVGSIHQNIRAMKNDLGAARAAHAEAQSLLRESFNLWHDDRAWDHHALLTRIDAHLAKYGKDASK